MEDMRPFRLMIGSRDFVDARTLVERARWAESIGCSHVCVHDHLAPQLAPISLLTAVAMTTDRLRFARSYSTTTFATRPSSPRSWRPLTS